MNEMIILHLLEKYFLLLPNKKDFGSIVTCILNLDDSSTRTKIPSLALSSSNPLSIIFLVFSLSIIFVALKITYLPFGFYFAELMWFELEHVSNVKMMYHHFDFYVLWIDETFHDVCKDFILEGFGLGE